MALTPKIVGDRVRMDRPDGLHEIVEVTEVTAGRYVCGGLWFSSAGVPLGSREQGYSIQDATADDANRYDALDVIRNIRHVDWESMSTADLTSVKDLIEPHINLPGA